MCQFTSCFMNTFVYWNGWASENSTPFKTLIHTHQVILVHAVSDTLGSYAFIIIITLFLFFIQIVHAFIYLVIYFLFICLPTLLLACLVHSFLQTSLFLVNVCSFVHSFVHSFIRLFFRLFVLLIFLCSFAVCSFIWHSTVVTPLFLKCFIPFFICHVFPLASRFVHLFISLFTHSKF